MIPLNGPQFVPDQDYHVEVHDCHTVFLLEEVATTIWGDTFPAGGDGIVDVDDIQSVLNAYVTCDVAQNCPPGFPFYPNDLMPCDPNGVLDVDDILAVLDAFLGNDYDLQCADPCTGTGQAGGGGGHGPGIQCLQANLSFAPASAGVEAGATVSLDVNVTCTTPIRGWELHTTITVGSAGSLTLENIVVNDALPNYLFQGASSVKAEHTSGARAAAARYEGGSSAWPTKYLATLTLRASSNARGTFNVALTAAPSTKIRGADGQTILWHSTPATVSID